MIGLEFLVVVPLLARLACVLRLPLVFASGLLPSALFEGRFCCYRQQLRASTDGVGTSASTFRWKREACCVRLFAFQVVLLFGVSDIVGFGRWGIGFDLRSSKC